MTVGMNMRHYFNPFSTVLWSVKLPGMRFRTMNWAIMNTIKATHNSNLYFRRKMTLTMMQDIAIIIGTSEFFMHC
jgi:hypothetical protein